MSHLAKPPPLKPLLVNGLTIFRLPEPPLLSHTHTNDLLNALLECIKFLPVYTHYILLTYLTVLSI